MGYSKQALSGFSWQTVLKIFTSGITFVKIIILARLLSPTDFGVFSIVAIALGITEAATQTGVNITLLQVKDNLKSYISSAWVIAIVRGIIMSIVMIGLAFVLSRYYDQPDLISLITVAASIPFIKGFINPYIISMQREFKFSKETFYHTFLQIIEGGSAIVLALLFQNVWIFIASMIIAALVEVWISFAFFETKPQFSFNKQKGLTILKNTKQFSVNALFSYLLENVDNLIVGKLLGTATLGLYQNAYAVSHKANYDFAKSLHHGALPAFGKISDDPIRMRRGFTKLFFSTLGIVTACSLPLLLFPDLLVRLALGEQWVAIIPSIRWLVAAGIVQSIIVIHYTVLFATKDIKGINIHLIVTFCLLVGGIIIGSQQIGLLGASMAVFYTRLLSLPLLMYLTHKSLQ